MELKDAQSTSRAAACVFSSPNFYIRYSLSSVQLQQHTLRRIKRRSVCVKLPVSFRTVRCAQILIVRLYLHSLPLYPTLNPFTCAASIHQWQALAVSPPALCSSFPSHFLLLRPSTGFGLFSPSPQPPARPAASAASPSVFVRDLLFLLTKL